MKSERKIVLRPVKCVRCKSVFEREHVPEGDWICPYCWAEMDARLEPSGSNCGNDMESRRLDEDWDGDFRNRQEAAQRKAMMDMKTCFDEPGDFEEDGGKEEEGLTQPCVRPENGRRRGCLEGVAPAIRGA